MERVVIALAIVVVVGVVAVVIRRRRPADAPTQVAHTVPQQLDRADFGHDDLDWLVVAFTSASCHTCADMVAKARAAETPQVGFEEIEYGAQRALHQKYGIDAVPTVVLVDRSGVVRRSFLGRNSATDLWAGIASARDEAEAS